MFEDAFAFPIGVPLRKDFKSLEGFFIPSACSRTIRTNSDREIPKRDARCFNRASTMGSSLTVMPMTIS